MVDRGNVDKYRRSMSGLRVENAETWGRGTARSRYGKLDSPDIRPKNFEGPQKMSPYGFNGERGPDWADDHPNDWVRGGPNESGKPPNFDPRGPNPPRNIKK